MRTVEVSLDNTALRRKRGCGIEMGSTTVQVLRGFENRAHYVTAAERLFEACAH